MQDLNSLDSVKNNNRASKSARDTYKPLFCNAEFYSIHQPHFIKIAQFFQVLTQTSFQQKVALWTYTLACLRRKKDWFGGVRSMSLQIFEPQNPDNFLISSLFKELEILWPKSLSSEMSLSEFSANVRIKPLPDSALRGLHYFLQKIYPLQILNYEPEPYELLQIQIQGKRVITFQDDFKNWPTRKYGSRDPLSFWLHDFIHSDHFFRDSENRKGQIGFYNFVFAILKTDLLHPLLLCENFSSDFSYLISDMNSHPVHLFKTFKAILDHYQFDAAKRAQISTNIWLKICENLQMSGSRSYQVAALRKVNSTLFADEDAIALLHLAHSLYK